MKSNASVSMRLMVCITVVQSFASVLVERGIFFFARDELGFSDQRNLLLAILFGGTYVVGAFIGHPLSRRFGERRLLIGAVAMTILALAPVALWPSAVSVFAGMALTGFLSGLKWPFVETYAAAGHTPKAAIRAIGTFNVAWGSAAPCAMLVQGVMLEFNPLTLFGLAVVLHVVSIFLIFRLPPVPPYLEEDHPDRPEAGELNRQVRLFAASRWLMLMSYVVGLVFSPLAPGIFGRLGFQTSIATALAGVMDWCRLVAFVALPLFAWWHGKVTPLIVSMLVLPVGLFMMLLGNGVTVVLLGQAVCGLAAGMVYYAALYYAMVAKNASVEAGGGHEGFIGIGLGLGPVAGLAGTLLAGKIGAVAGMSLGIGPFLAVCAAGALWALTRKAKM